MATLERDKEFRKKFNSIFYGGIYFIGDLQVAVMPITSVIIFKIMKQKVMSGYGIKIPMSKELIIH